MDTYTTTIKNKDVLNYPKNIKSILIVMLRCKLLPNEILFEIFYQLYLICGIENYLTNTNTKKYKFGYELMDISCCTPSCKDISHNIMYGECIPCYKLSKKKIYINKHCNFEKRYREYLDIIKSQRSDLYYCKFKIIELSYYIMKSISNVLNLNILYLILISHNDDKYKYVFDIIKHLKDLINNSNVCLNNNKYVYVCKDKYTLRDFNGNAARYILQYKSILDNII